jgi:predicted permease
VRQLLTDSLVLAGLGAVGGLAIAFGLVRALSISRPDLLPSTGAPGIDSGVLLFALGASVLAAALVGVLPALRVAEADLHEGLREGARGMGGGRRSGRFRGALVVAQTGMAILLLVGAGLMVRTYAALANIDPGFGAEEVLTLRLATPAGSYPEREDVVGFYRTLLDRVRTIPGVASAGIVRLLPLASEIGDAGTVVDGYVPQPGETVSADWQFASPGYFESLGIPIVSGRTFHEADDVEGAPVILVNESFAEKYLAGREPIGARVRIGNPSRPWTSIVGVVGNVTHNGITADVKPMWYRPHAQFVEFSANVQRRMTLVLRTNGMRAAALEQPVLRTLRELDPMMAATDVRTIAEVRASAVERPRFTLTLLAAFSVLAVIVAASGLYGVISYGVARRSRELGVRIALGARRADVMKLIIRGGLSMVGIGIGVGVLAAVALTRFLETQLYGVAPLDPSTYVLVCCSFLLVALAATWLPARRAAAVQPMEALRAD